MGLLLLIPGVILAVIGGFWLLVVAWRESPLWGLGAFLVPIVGLIYALMHWEDAKAPFLTQAGGVVLIIAGRVLMQG